MGAMAVLSRASEVVTKSGAVTTPVNVLAPAQLCAPVVTTPEAVALAVGKVTLLPVEEVMVGPEVVPALTPRFVATLTWAPAAMPSSFTLSAALMDPAADVVAARRLIDGLLPPLETIGAEPLTEFTPAVAVVT